VVAAVEVTLEAVVETTVELVVVAAAFEPHDVVIINKTAIKPAVSPQTTNFNCFFFKRLSSLFR
jgi:hypothetical protein